jgi:8-oxo-dGTP pyrophosphatase MutT (NUDIX family)
MPRKNGPWTINGSKTVYKTPWMELKEDSVIAPNGKDSVYGVLKLKDWVLIVPIDKEGNVYLVKQFRYAFGSDSIEVPAGCVDKGEKPIVAAKRELSEEVGITAKKWTSLGKTKISPSQIENTSYFFLAEDLSFGKSHQDETEGITPIKVSLEKAMEMVESGEIIDESVCSAILRAKRVLDKMKSISLV